ncbi:GatB/YqeY domain-containing protein [Arthrobacter sp. KN11-1C]|uniref:GatB/YqeY domain-containing protein n=1 Tax=Arthrobacter sp. KN11-1C TaxID=3445774 RepID=UPI003F9F628F
MPITRCQEGACSAGLLGVVGQAPIHLDDAQITTMLQKEASQYHEVARLYEEAGESERAATEIADAEVIEAYLPAPLTAADVESEPSREHAPCSSRAMDIVPICPLLAAGRGHAQGFFFPPLAAGGSPAVSISGSATVPRQRARPFMPW